MTPERLNELQALCDAATPGPWFRWFELTEMEGDISTNEDGKDPGYAIVSGAWFQGDQDRAFIAAARTALPELIARVRELEASFGIRWAADMRAIKALANAPLDCTIEDDALVVRIGINTLAMAAEWNPRACEGYRDGPYCKVVDVGELARDVRNELLREEEDGSTPLHHLIDRCCENAMDNGSLAFADEETNQ